MRQAIVLLLQKISLFFISLIVKICHHENEKVAVGEIDEFSRTGYVEYADICQHCGHIDMDSVDAHMMEQ